MPDLVSNYRDAGFTDAEIAEHIGGMRQKYRDAGFTDPEIDAHLGMPKTPTKVPEALVDRMLAATDFAGKVTALPKAIGDIPHEAVATTVEAARGIVQNLVPKSLGGGREPGQEGTLEGIGKTGAGLLNIIGLPFAPLQGAIRSLVGHPMVATDEALRAGAVALLGEDKVAKAQAAVGEEPAPMTFEQAKQRADTALLALGRRPISRLAIGPTGEPEISTVGGLPRGEDFSEAGRVLGNGDTTPLMESKLADLYEKQGVHPSEVAHDAQSDPTITQSILSSDPKDMPGGYGKPPPEEPPAAAAGKPPAYSDAEKQILSKISIGEKAPEAKLTFDKLYTNFVDKLFPINKAVKEAGLADLAAEDNPYQLARLLHGHVGKADHFLNHGTFDFATYENNGPGLKDILKPVSSDLNGFRAYATASRALELEGRGIKSGFDFEGSSAPPLVSEGLEAARTVVAEGAAKFDKPFKALVEYQNRVSQYLKDSGVLSEGGYRAMVQANEMYVPFTRVMGIDEAAQARGGSTLQATNPVKAIKGSARAIVDPIESVVRNTYHFVEMAEKNQVGTKLVDMLKRASAELPESPSAVETLAGKDTPRAGAIAESLGEVGIKKPEDLAAALAHATEPRKPGEIAILRDGKRETYAVDPDLARAMKGLDAQSVGLLEKVLAFPASTLRAGAVLTPDFALRHTIRDFFYATTTFKGGVFTPLDMAKGFSGLITKDADYWNWLKGGGGNISVAALDRQYLQQDLRKLTGQTGLVGRAWNVLADPEASMWDKTGALGKLPFQAISKFVLDPLRVATQFAENASHLGAFKKTLRASERAEPAATDLRGQIIRAAWESRDTAVDAARMGANMRAYNMITAFANIKLQDTDRVVRAIKDNPVATLAKIGAAITVPSVVLWAANHDDPRYDEIPQWQKDMSWIVMTPDHIFRIPKPWAMGMVFGSLPERLLDQFYRNKPDSFKKYFESLWATSGPDFIPTAASPIIDHFANRSTFTNRTLIPSAQEKFLPEYQYTPYTTELTKKLGQVIGAFPGMSELKMEHSGWGGTARALTSPILMENYIRGWTGTLGMYVLQAADAALRKTGQLPDPPKPASTLADIPVIRAFAVRYPSANAESIQSFYDEFEKNKSYFDTYTAKAKDGDFAAMQHISDMGGPMMFAQLDGIKQTLNEHSQLVRDIFKNEQIPPDEKRQLIDTLYGNMIMVSRNGNEAIREMRRQSLLLEAEAHQQPAPRQPIDLRGLEQAPGPVPH